MENIGGIITAIAIAIIGPVIGYILGGRRKAISDAKLSNGNAEKAKAEASKIMGDAWTALFNELEERINCQSSTILEQSRKLAEMEGFHQRMITLEAETTRQGLIIAEQGRTIVELSAQSAKKDTEIASLRRALETREKELSEMRAEVATLRKQVNTSRDIP